MAVEICSTVEDPQRNNCCILRDHISRHAQFLEQETSFFNIYFAAAIPKWSAVQPNGYGPSGCFEIKPSSTVSANAVFTPGYCLLPTYC